MFATGLFYENDTEEDADDEESEKSFVEALESFSIRDFWIVVYSLLITFTIPIILKYFFRRKEIDYSKNAAKQLRVQRIKRVIGYGLAVAIVIWCSWSCVAFSISFGYNPAQTWLISFSAEKIFDLFIIDPITGVIIFSISGYIAAKKRKNASTIAPIGSDDAGFEVTVSELERQGTLKSLPDLPKQNVSKDTRTRIFGKGSENNITS